MGRSSLQIKGYTPEDIKTLMREKPDYEIGMKLLAIYQISRGISSRKLEECYNKSFKQLFNWSHRFEEQGIEGLKDKDGRGRKPGLDDKQMERLKELVTQESPSSYGYNTATWTDPLVQQWIEKNMGVSYKKAQVYNILHKLGLSHQKARATYPETDPEAQDRFKEELKKLLESPDDTALIFEDEFSLSNTATVNYARSVKGRQPLVKAKQRNRERKTAVGSYNFYTDQMTVSFHDKGNYKTFKKHLRKILRTYKSNSKIIVVADNVRFHYALKLREWLKTKPRLELVYLPPYSPELNPIERAWWYIRKRITQNRYLNTLR
jgi:transposase